MHARADTCDTAPNWPDDIFATLQRFDVRQVPYVPDAGHSKLIQRVLGSSTMRGIPLTTEEEGVALLAGAWTGGQRGVLLMQSSLRTARIWLRSAGSAPRPMTSPPPGTVRATSICGAAWAVLR